LILEHNLTATMLLGEEKKGLDRKPITRFIVKEDQDIFYLHRKKIIDTGSIQSCELRMLVGGASEIWVRIQSTLAQANSGIPIFHLVLSDITERKNAEFERIYALDALKQSEARYLAIIEEQAELVCRYLPDGRLSFVNEAYVRYFGKKREEIMNCNYIPNIPAFDLPLIQENLGAITKDSPLAKFEHRVIMPDGKVRWQHWLHRGIYSPEGVLVEYQAVGRDVTDSIESAQEREHLLAELARKNEELERFTYTVSHDLKAPLHTIQGFAQEIQESIAENDYSHVSDYLSRIQNGARRMGEMLQDLIKLARLGHVANAFGPISLNNTLAEVQDAVAGLLSTHHVALDVSPSLPTIQGCSIRLHELFQNLIENAIKFRLRDGSARIEVGVEESPTKWSVFVKDNGIGVAPAHQKTIFGLFQKLNPKSEGSGIGLSLVSRIAQMHKAQVNIESAGEGRGCTFWLHFPKEIVL
jgi:PAS domain S-box-containing protein